MPKKPNYATLYTLRADGRYQGYWRDAQGKRHALCDRDPARLYERLREKENAPAAAPLTFSANFLASKEGCLRQRLVAMLD